MLSIQTPQAGRQLVFFSSTTFFSQAWLDTCDHRNEAYLGVTMIDPFFIHHTKMHGDDVKLPKKLIYSLNPTIMIVIIWWLKQDESQSFGKSYQDRM